VESPQRTERNSSTTSTAAADTRNQLKPSASESTPPPETSREHFSPNHHDQLATTSFRGQHRRYFSVRNFTAQLMHLQDFEGQKLVEKIIHFSFSAVTVTCSRRAYHVNSTDMFQAFSFVLGFALQSLQVTFAVLGASVLLLALVIVPPWPSYNNNPVKWLPNKETKKNQ
jgi:signal peptidase complex subunit 1